MGTAGGARVVGAADSVDTNKVLSCNCTSSSSYPGEGMQEEKVKLRLQVRQDVLHGRQLVCCAHMICHYLVEQSHM